MKKTLKLALVAASLVAGTSAFAGNEQTADEAKARLVGLKEVFKEFGLNTFNFLNGLDGAGQGKNRENQVGLRWAEYTKSDDGKGSLICVQNGKYMTNQLHPTMTGKDTMSGSDTWRDGQGMPMTDKVVKAMENSRDGFGDVAYVDTHGDVSDAREGKAVEEKKRLMFMSLKGIEDAGDAGGFCATEYVQFDPTDESDRMRMDKPDHEGSKKRHGKKHHAKKHHAKKEAHKAEGHKEAAPAEKTAKA